jgi:ornithine carbamoyltransferase
VGDGNNMANSWINAAGIFKFELRISCPQGYDPGNAMIARAKKKGADIRLVRKPLEAARNADVLYTDVWVSMGQEKEKTRRTRAFKSYQINQKLVTAAASDVKVMHCLPAHRGQEITDAVIEGEHSIVFDQAENRLHAQKAILELLVSG